MCHERKRHQQFKIEDEEQMAIQNSWIPSWLLWVGWETFMLSYCTITILRHRNVQYVQHIPRLCCKRHSQIDC